MKFTDALDRLNTAIGRAISWLTLGMVIVTFIIVVMRYLFDTGWIWLQESVTWMHAAVFMLAAAYTLSNEDHVRVDIFYGKFSERGKAIVNSLGVLFFLLPVAGFLLVSSWGYVADSWAMQESSGDAGGLAYPFPSLAKSLIPLMAGMLVLQGLVLIVRSIESLRHTD